MTSAHRSPALTVSVGMFGVGLLAVLVIFGLAATGLHDLPVWLNLTAMLAPFGLALGVVSAIAQARRQHSARNRSTPETSS